ncbi:NAD(P)-dependent dehydrogenase (short-subunit alcohol dehydrogenase family) [Variovorax sp. Sphag1AA]|nr:NAD(P)-dependent dehydrogenase (short-subunit alcohol dehydrogenase family) [Variovorax sp. Sphag1AA]
MASQLLMSDQVKRRHGTGTRMDEKIFRLDNRIAVVTGGSGGIGAAICKLFAKVGASVACIDLDTERVNATAAAIEAEGGRAIAITCDVSSEAQTLDAVQRLVAELGKPTVLVNSIAALDRSGSILEIDLAEWEKVHRVNLTGSFLMSRAVLPWMVEAGGGSVIHVSSMNAHVAAPGRVSYASTKSALLQLGRVMAVDHAAQGVRVNILSPGPVDTVRISFRQQGHSEAEKKASLDRYLLKRLGRPEEVAAAALFLASDASSFVTGSELAVDGGCTIYKG